MKRIFDIIFSGSIILMALPVYALAWLLIVATMGRPAIFIQKRPGLHGKIFNLYKFRTMKNQLPGSDANLSDEERLTPVGQLLRRLSIDELPQLLNVLRGEMSIVGPRPLLEEYLPLYTSEQAKRHDIKPGITGWAQINGRNAISWEDKFRLDVWYVENQSLALDMKIIFLTIYRVFSGSGVSQHGQVGMQKFTGSTDI